MSRVVVAYTGSLLYSHFWGKLLGIQPPPERPSCFMATSAFNHPAAERGSYQADLGKVVEYESFLWRFSSLPWKKSQLVRRGGWVTPERIFRLLNHDVPLGTVFVESGKYQPPHFLLHSLRALGSYQWQIWGLKWLGWGAYDVAIGAENILSMERFLRDPVGFSYASLKIKSVDHRFIWRGEFILQYSMKIGLLSMLMFLTKYNAPDLLSRVGNWSLNERYHVAYEFDQCGVHTSRASTAPDITHMLFLQAIEIPTLPYFNGTETKNKYHPACK
ncbi:hypothetical protein I7I51_09103 [Histoplasma capsulatum]|uniref:Uncharacterized protein n=1 Tax=Ajellomyces capsulatus TaxID=5037 RepID=A0A8A1M653_AJECA|nr:hypothetical protein I7I51_09103 [Histoplasma capsulatum]